MNLVDIETPAVLIDLNIVENNIDKYRPTAIKKASIFGHI